MSTPCAIMYEADWDRFPSAIPDFKTNNQSFVTISRKLKMMGVRNHLWPLALLDRDLVGLDPLKEEGLTENDCYKIGQEAVNNPWYYFRELACCPARAGANKTRITANRANLALWWCYFANMTVILTQPRQTGKSMCTESLIEYLLTLKGDGYPIGMLTRSLLLQSECLERIKNMTEQLPSYLFQRIPGDRWNTQEIRVEFPAGEKRKEANTFKSIITSDSEHGAHNSGRGMGVATPIVDEGPFQKLIAIALKAAFAAATTLQDIAEEYNQPWGAILTTTAGDPSTEAGKYIWKYICDGSLFSEVFYDQPSRKALEEFVRSLTRTEQNPYGTYRTYAVFTHRQLGYDDNWLLRRKEVSDQTGDDFARDFLCVWKVGGVGSPFSPQVQEKIVKSKCLEPDTDFSNQEFHIQWNRPRNEALRLFVNGSVVMGLDTSDALGGDGDSVGLTFVDVETGRTIGAGKTNSINLFDFAVYLKDWLVMYPKLILIPERKSSATAILDHLERLLRAAGIDIFKRVFNWVASEPEAHRDDQQYLSQSVYRRPAGFYEDRKKYFGFATSSSGKQARDELYGNFIMEMTKEFGHLVESPILVDQLLSLIRDKRGRIDHPEGGHDDVVISWLLCHWFLQKTRNLSHYGINPRIVMMAANAEVESPTQRLHRIEQANTIAELEQTLQLIKLSNNQSVREKLEMKAKMFHSLIDQTDTNYAALDAKLQEVLRNTTRKDQPMTDDLRWAREKRQYYSNGVYNIG